MVEATIGKWGNAAGLRIPQAFCSKLGLHINDKVLIDVTDNELVIRKPAEKYSLAARMEGWNGQRYTSEEIEWGEACGEEIW